VYGKWLVNTVIGFSVTLVAKKNFVVYNVTNMADYVQIQNLPLFLWHGYYMCMCVMLTGGLRGVLNSVA
jgi:hypothetical protein